ncbi:MAG: hypothetical protein HYR75_09400, partial [Gemmatimonadetes bacterium]|nr:hypothetical protein [Gemmatimonadota bacterium]
MAFALSTHAGDPARLATPLLAVALGADAKFPRALAALDRSTGGALSRALKERDFKGGRDETLLVLAKGSGP